MRSLPLAVLLLAAACAQQPDGTTTLTPSATKALADLCAKDAQIQPVALAGVQTGAVLAPVVVPGKPGATVSGVMATGAALDSSILHPTVQNACAQLPQFAPAATK